MGLCVPHGDGVTGVVGVVRAMRERERERPRRGEEERRNGKRGRERRTGKGNKGGEAEDTGRKKHSGRKKKAQVRTGRKEEGTSNESACGSRVPVRIGLSLGIGRFGLGTGSLQTSPASSQPLSSVSLWKCQCQTITRKQPPGDEDGGGGRYYWYMRVQIQGIFHFPRRSWFVELMVHRDLVADADAHKDEDDMKQEKQEEQEEEDEKVIYGADSWFLPRRSCFQSLTLAINQSLQLA